MGKLPCLECGKKCKGQRGLADHMKAVHHLMAGEVDLEPDFEGECEVCGQSPVVPETGMCGPCSFGEADTIGGEW